MKTPKDNRGSTFAEEKLSTFQKKRRPQREYGLNIHESEAKHVLKEIKTPKRIGTQHLRKRS
jgi:hypothetical protein